ncbi:MULTISPECIES: LysR family transcriptional regulator [Rhizobium]|uniref:DNA-binding transcriptional LysR family regulator n=1 Tax=Rhizobium esperanzae TaxID=1967781 RepID=A0A7W6XWI4_9HYPH|nr:MULTISPECIES: LysR family transcriptional regulator [Rhizobium]MBB4440467.1 DNA-binding transcriptional LysR family regulator [Rhizobium esperanzae]MDH6203111.1 LysR family transcriptional regulator of gallate degradation [Rhizobium leguminosarum]
MNLTASQASQVQHNLRHLRVFLAVVDTNSVTRAADVCHLSQPAVTQALSKIERALRTTLFTRTSQGLFANAQGDVLAKRVRRAFGFLDPALNELSPRLRMVATSSQLQALIAVREAENFTLAARRLGLAQPTVHRAVTQLEEEAARPLFERTSYGIVATRAAGTLAQAARLAFAELAQAEVDLAETLSEEAGRIVVGAMPLSRSFVLPRAIAEFRKFRPNTPIHILEGPYADLLAGLRRGEIDFLIGALRDPAPIGDVEQRFLFNDTLVVVAGGNHPLTARSELSVEELAAYPWIVGQRGTPIRQHFDTLFEGLDHPPTSIVESSSLILMRELLNGTEHLGCISYLQAQAELSRGLLKALPLDLSHTARPIGLTLRINWMPTRAQEQFLRFVSSNEEPATETP